MGAPSAPHEAIAFGTELRRLRLEAGLTREALAERADVSLATLAALEGGQRRRPYPHTVVALAEALGLTADEGTRLLELASGSAVPAAAAALAPPPTPAPARPTRRVRLPVPPTVLIGRESDTAVATALLDPARSAVRLLTLTGPGGVGKTRLALAVAGALVDAYPDGVVFVDLAPLRDSRLVPATIAHALEVRESGGRSAREVLRGYLHDRQLLLVLDDFEHLLAAAPLLSDLLEACPRLALLVTSRRVLRLRAEQRFLVAPLAAPADEPLSPEALAASPAIRLFVERAQAVAPDFALDAGNAPAVAALCRRLDGLPLAIELAAARVGLLRPAALLRRLEHRLPLPTRGAADLPERQQTLRHTLAWSHDLLGPAEQELFRCLAVFAGGWTLEAAEAVCGGAEARAEDVLERLGVLVDTSLVHCTVGAAGEPRFGMLETIREDALERLAAAGELAAARRHRDWCLALAEAEDPVWVEPAQVARLEREQDNLRAALRWSIQHHDAAAGLRLGIGGWPLWYQRGRYAEGRGWLAEVLGLGEAATEPGLRSRALAFAGHLAYCEGDIAAAEALLHDGLAQAEQVGDAPAVGMAAHFLGNVARLRGDLAETEAYYERARALAHQTGGRGWETLAVGLLAQICFERGDTARTHAFIAEAFGLYAGHDHLTGRGHLLALRGRLAALAGDQVAAREWVEASLELFGVVGEPQGLIYAHRLAAYSALDRADWTDAAGHLQAMLTSARESRDQAAVVRALEAIGELLTGLGQPERALRLAGTAAALRQTLGVRTVPIEAARLDRWLARARVGVGGGAEAALAAGRGTPLEAAVDEALAACGTPGAVAQS